MAPKHDILYVQFDSEEDLAMKPKQPKPFGTTLKFLMDGDRKKKLVIRLDPVAMFGTLVALAMLVCMVVGMIHLQNLRQENAQLQGYVQQVRDENQQLRTKYQEGYDLETVREEALAMGMIPSQDAMQAQLSMEICKEQPENVNVLDQVYAFLTGPFA